MDLVSREVVPPVSKVEERSADLSTNELLPSLFAEIAAQTATEQVDGLSSRERSRPCRTAHPPRQKLRRSKRRPLSPGEVVVGTLAGINDDGQPLVRHSLDSSGRIVLARTTVPVTAELVDREVVIAFESGDIDRPIVIGVLCQTDGQDHANYPAAPPTVRQPVVQATLDGEQLVFTAENEIVLRCGKASLTLTRAGKILIRGTYLLSRSSGVNRIKGGSVQLN
jgi:hypothetical protein